MPIAAEIYYHLYEGGVEGETPPVVLIHGAGGNYLYWPPYVRRLKGNRVYALDLPGHGKSAGTGRQSISGYAQSVLSWMETVGIHSAIFVGHSMGGAIVQILALDHSQHVLGLGLISTGARLHVSPDLLESTANKTTFHQAVENIINWSFSSHASPRLIELASKRMEEVRPSVLHGDFLACDVFDECDRLREIHQPTLVLCGSEDKMTPVRNSQYLADNISFSKLEILPDAGHMVMLEQPQAVADALSDFVGSINYL